MAHASANSSHGQLLPIESPYYKKFIDAIDTNSSSSFIDVEPVSTDNFLTLYSEKITWDLNGVEATINLKTITVDKTVDSVEKSDDQDDTEYQATEAKNIYNNEILTNKIVEEDLGALDASSTKERTYLHASPKEPQQTQISKRRISDSINANYPATNASIAAIHWAG